ncbi:GEVED domain-containing protein [Lacinutrix himadriensis]|uniref:GEVED domain-containing protein n=1 Tax=Lacinutrix himadriensis TaxID=641549 RepID=UPI0006E3E45F|nr:GEVED domain-containing protein [Lacinutrix himadriensis]
MKKNYLLLLIAFLCSIVFGFGQTTVTYDFSASGAVTGLNEASPGITLDANIGFGSFKNSGTSNPALNGGQLRLYQNATKGGSIIIYASNGATITKVVVNASGTTGPAGYTVDGTFVANFSASNTYTMSGLNATSDVEFYQKDSSSGNRIYVDDIEVTYTMPSVGPTISVSPATLTGLDYEVGSGPSGVQTYQISGSNLTPANGLITVSLPTPSINSNFLISNDGLNFSTTSLYYPYVGGTLPSFTISVMLKPGLPVGTYGLNISHSGGGATTQNLAVSGEVTAVYVGPCGELDFTGAGNSGSYSTNTWTDTGVSWTGTDSRGDQDLNGAEAIMLRNGSLTNNAPIPGGMGTITFDYARIYSGNSTLKVFVNGTQYGSDISVTSTSSTTFTSTVNLGGNISLELENSGNRTLINNLSWTCYTATPCSGTPTPGNTVSSETSVLTGGTTNLSLQNVTAGSGVTYQWQSSTTSASTGFTNITGATNATYTATVNTKTWYRCVVTCSGNDGTSTAVAVDVTYASPNNGLQLKACIANTQVSLSWNASSTAGVTGYIVFAQPNATIPQMAAASAGNASTYIANTDYSAATTYTTLGKAVYKGAGTTATITGLTNASQYTFKVVAYTGETGTGWASAINNTSAASSYTQTYTIDVPEVSNLAASINPTTSTVSWNVVPDSAGCYEYMVVANAGPVTLTPTGNGSAYTANSVYAGANSVVYKGTGNTITITGLTDAVEYCYTVFVREVNSGNQWSDGISVCQTTGVDYCTASGGTNNSMIKNVTFNTINQSSTSNAGYTNYTAVSTNVNIGDTHNLSVTVNTNGNYTSYVIAWIDWNRDGDFNDSGEAYELGTVTNDANGTSSASPFSITVPTGAALGNVRMRVSANSQNSISDYATSCESFTFGEVEDYTVNVTQPTNAEINVKGGTISIANGFDAPYGLNNTLFASTPLNTDSVEKEFTIENIGLANLFLTGSPIIELEGTNPTDFIVTQQATSPVVNGINTTFRIKFHPTIAGTRTAKVRIESNDADENPYLFTIEGNGNCSTAPTVAAFPTSGPANTLVTLTSATSNLTGATVTFNNIVVPTISNTTDTIEVFIPSDANDGNFVIELATGCSATQFFDVIDTDLTACDTGVGGGDASDLVIYEVYDENGGSGGVITIYNNTGAAVNLTGYKIQRAGDYGGSYATYANLSGTLAANAVALVSVTSSSCGYTTTGHGSLGNAGFNANDGFRLMNGTTLIDDVHAPNYVGYYLKRKNTNFYPNTTYDATEWTAQSLAEDECLAGVGSVPLVKIPPVVTTHPQYIENCAITGTSLNVTGSEGVSGGLTLAYQWFVLGTSGNWTAVSNGGIYSGATTATLDISDISGLDDYQYYCQIRENTGTCYAASEAVKVSVNKAEWDGTQWLDGITPDMDTITIINGNYNTTTNGSFSACQLFINAGNQLVVTDGHYVEVINNVDVYGNGTGLDGVLVEDKGSFVQRDGANAGTYTLHTDAVTQVNKRTAPLNNYYEYTYWSSPVVGETIGNGLLEAHPTRRYWYNGQNYLDQTAETNNNNGTIAGQDDIDDNGNDWQSTSNSDIMLPGIGYAAMHNQTGFGMPGANYEYTFEGALHTGDYTVPIYRNDLESNDNNWNFIGNPYASAIDADVFLAANTIIDTNVSETTTGVTDGAIFLWSQDSPYTDTNNGNQVLNFAQSDYAVINGTGQTSGGDGITPTRHIPSGQGFFISLSDAATTTTVSGDIKTADVIFNNSMRVTGNNNQFFRTENNNSHEKIWVNLTSDNGVFNQVLIGYVPGATNAYDGMYYDAPKNLSAGSHSILYSIIDATNGKDKLAIQGKSPESLHLEEVIPLGFKTSINEATIYTFSITQLEGEFLTNNTIYVHDKLMHVIHDLSASNYTFTSETGEHNDRFEIVFQDTTLSIDENQLSNALTMIEQPDGTVKFSTSNALQIKNVKVYDVLGRLLYNLNGNSSTEIYTLDKLSQAAYVAKVTLSNDVVITKKAIKRN